MEPVSQSLGLLSTKADDTTDDFIELTSYRDQVDAVITQSGNAFFHLRLNSLPRNVVESPSAKIL